MYIKQHRIQNLRFLSNLKPDAKFSLVIKDVEKFSSQIKQFGFDNPSNGLKILPAIYNNQSRKNAEVYFTIDKSKEQETYYQTVYWTRTEWAGRGETREVTDFTDIPHKRYHRDYHNPYSVEFTYVEEKNEKFIISDSLYNSVSNESKNLNTINMLLYLLGECYVESEEFKSDIPIRRLNWDILPHGKYPWEKVKSEIESISQKYKNTQKQMMLRNCEQINSKNPDFVAYGKAGFRGYAVFGFTEKNLYILESVIPNNATYVFQENWEYLSSLTKAEILCNSLAKQRIIHNSRWEKEFTKLWKEKYE